METRTRSLTSGETSTFEAVSAVIVALAAVATVLGFAGLFMVIPATATVAGVQVATLVGGLLAALGLAILAAGVLSAAELIETSPSPTTGLVTGVSYGLLTLVVVGLVTSQTLGLSMLWPVLALVAAVGVAFGTAVAREDLGATVPAGVYLLFSGGLIATGVIAPGFSWQPGGMSGTITGVIAVPLLAVVGGLIAVWVSARAYGGFGARGRQNGAYALIGATVIAILSVLVMVVAFVVWKGFGPMTDGIQWGLYLDFYHYFHVHVPIWDKYVAVNGPKLWFYWPFVMEPYHPLGQAPNGILPAIVGTVWLVLGAVVMAVPLGVGAAVFLTEYAEQGRFTQLVEVSTNGLWSTPSIVYGLFGLAFLVPRFGNQNSILAGQIVLGSMLLPLVLITSRESLKSVPDDYRNASAALGVGRWQTIKSVVVPAAMPGVITGVILGVGRIAGETAPILLVTLGEPLPSSAPEVITGSFAFTGSFPFVTVPTIDLVQSASALPLQLYTVISAGLSENLSFAWGTALVLLLVVLSFYAVGIASRIYFRKKLHQ